MSVSIFSTIKKGISNGIRNFSDKTLSSPKSTPHPPNPSVIEQPKMTPSALDRIFLTWSGQFKNKSDIPSRIAGDVVHRARSYARIRINIGFLLIGVIASGIFVYMGKQDAKKGQSLEKTNLEWHRQINEDHKRTGGN